MMARFKLYLDPISPHQLKENLSEVDPLWQNLLNPRMSSIGIATIWLLSLVCLVMRIHDKRHTLYWLHIFIKIYKSCCIANSIQDNILQPLVLLQLKVKKAAKIRDQYNQVPH